MLSKSFSVFFVLAIGGVLSQSSTPRPVSWITPPNFILLNCNLTFLLQLGSPIYLENSFYNLPDPSIIQGEMAQPGEIPYQAYLISSRFFGLIQATCGGSLIRDTWVLTAAHCIHRMTKTEVRLGGTNVNQMSYVQTATLLKMHEGYNPSTFANDVALLRLPMAATGENIAVIALPPMDIGALENELVTVSGYGKTSNNGEGSPDLLKVQLRTITNEECAAEYGPAITESNICAFYSTEPGQSACQGDSGGPMTYNSTDGSVLVGVVSFGSTNGCDTVPVAYARVSSFLEWINTNIMQNTV